METKGVETLKRERSLFGVKRSICLLGNLLLLLHRSKIRNEFKKKNLFSTISIDEVVELNKMTLNSHYPLYIKSKFGYTEPSSQY